MCYKVSNTLINEASNCSTTAVYPQNTLSSPLTLHLEPKVKSQIWSNTYINFDILLPKKELKTPRYKFYDGEKEGTGIPGFVKEQFVTTQIRNMSQWLEAFHIFVSRYCEKYPSQCIDLMKFCSIVRTVAKMQQMMQLCYMTSRFES